MGPTNTLTCHGKVAVMSRSSSDPTTSASEEADDFVQCQLLLSTAIKAYFDVERSDCRTLFRDDFPE